MKLFLEVTVMFYVTGLGDCGDSYHYEKLNNFGIGRRVIPNLRRQILFGQARAYPEPLPSSSHRPPAKQPYANIVQGKRVHKDVRIYKKTFKYPATLDGHRVTCKNNFNCQITYLTIDTDKGIPIILRGGAGYHHFTAVVRARPGEPLAGTITAYCVKNVDDDSWKIN